MKCHSPVCRSAQYERAGEGDFAVRAFAAGDLSTPPRSSDPVASVLPSLVVYDSGVELAQAELRTLPLADLGTLSTSR